MKKTSLLRSFIIMGIIAVTSMSSLPLLAQEDFVKVQTLGGHSGRIFSVAFSPDGKYFATGGDDKSVKIWKFDNGKFTEILNMKGKNPSASVTFSKDGKFLAAVDGKLITVWTPNGDNFSEVQKLKGHSNMIYRLDFSPDGNFLVSASSDKKVIVWKLSGSKFKKDQTLKESDKVYSAAFSHDGKSIATGSMDNTIKIWELSGKKFKKTQTLTGHSMYAFGLDFSPDGNFIITGSGDKSTKLWKQENGKFSEVQTILDEEDPVAGVGFSPDGKYAVSGTFSTVNLRKLENGKLIDVQKLEGYGGTIYSAVFSPDGNYLIGSGTGKINVWQRGGAKESFKAGDDLETGTVTDIDGNEYKTVVLGNQEWMTENLKVKHYRNGDAIPKIPDGPDWKEQTTGAYVAYNNDESKVTAYGYLYNWHAVNDSRNIAPEGWHVATDEEWNELEAFLGKSFAGVKLKESGTSHWRFDDKDIRQGEKESGFMALPGGARQYKSEYKDITRIAYFWSSTEHNGGNAWLRYLDVLSNKVGKHYEEKINGSSVRLIKDREGGVTAAAGSSSGGSETLTDVNDNVYKTVKIGDQVWTAENLRATHYRNGDAIPNIKNKKQWGKMSMGAYAAYKNKEQNAETYGYLYNWHAVNDPRNLAPEGWHVATDEDWKELEMFLGMSQADADKDKSRGIDEGGKLKEVGTDHWRVPSNGTNESGFTALPGGFRQYLMGNDRDMGRHAFFWSSTEVDKRRAWYHRLTFDESNISRRKESKISGYSVRLVKDK